MKLKYFFLTSLIFSIFFLNIVKSDLNNKIIAKIGNDIITNFDLINEVNTILALSNRKAEKEKIVVYQQMAYSNLRQITIKEQAIESYEIDNFNEKDLVNYISTLEKNLGIQEYSLRDHFKKFGANYDLFIKNTQINLKWNTLIFLLYQKELDVDESLIKSDIDQEIKNNKEIIEYNLSEIVMVDTDTLVNVKKSIIDKGFEKSAILLSKSVTSAKGGVIGWVSSSSISPNYLSEIKKLKINEVSAPIKNNNNIVFLKLNDKRILSKKNIDLDRIKKNIINKKKQEKLNIFSNSHYLDLEKKTYIEIYE
tara:strand:- start:4 stop:930 length:927 start_codon:yes stop_codon:yes gene_type:complete